MTEQHVLHVSDLSPDAFRNILNQTDELKSRRHEINENVLADRSICMLFEKPSTRTRVSFEVGIHELGGNPVVLNASEIQLSRGEPVRDTARVLTRYGAGVVARVYDHKSLEDLAEYGSVPVINALSDRSHPCQILGDFFTIKEKKGNPSDQVLAYIGDGNNVCHSLLLGTALMGGTIRIASPSGYRPSEEICAMADRLNESSGGQFDVLNDPEQAVQNADVLYTDVWASMGQEDEKEERVKAFQDYQVNSSLVNLADEEAVVMHCLPAHRGEEITDDVIEGAQSVVWDQAENRLHAQKALLVSIYG